MNLEKLILNEKLKTIEVSKRSLLKKKDIKVKEIKCLTVKLVKRIVQDVTFWLTTAPERSKRHRNPPAANAGKATITGT